MIEVGIIRRVLAATLLLLAIIGFPCVEGATYAPAANPYAYYVWNTNSLQQDVSGEGYYMVYQDVNTNNLSLNNYMHGSGAFDSATIINSKQLKDKTVEYYKDDVKGTYAKYKNFDSTISFTSQNEITQSPESFAYGTGWYQAHPVVYNSLLKQKTDGKNYQAGISQEHQIEYARALKSDVQELLNCTQPTAVADSTGSAEMVLEESITQGTLHVSEMLTRQDNGNNLKGRVGLGIGDSPDLNLKGGVRSPLILVDENYVGNFDVKKDMFVNVQKKKPSQIVDWLPCCSGGFADLIATNAPGTGDTRYSQGGIFDCTCYKVPSQAQFPEPPKPAQ